MKTTRSKKGHFNKILNLSKRKGILLEGKHQKDLTDTIVT